MKFLIALSFAIALSAGGTVMAGTGASCSINPNPAAVGQTYTVSAQGLPMNKAINLFTTDPTGVTTGEALGSASVPTDTNPGGTFDLPRSSNTAGTWTYQFTGAVRGNDNKTVYATCSVVVQ